MRRGEDFGSGEGLARVQEEHSSNGAGRRLTRIELLRPRFTPEGECFLVCLLVWRAQASHSVHRTPECCAVWRVAACNCGTRSAASKQRASDRMREAPVDVGLEGQDQEGLELAVVRDAGDLLDGRRPGSAALQSEGITSKVRWAAALSSKCMR